MPPPAGLHNLGNTCFANALLQCFASSENITAFVDNCRGTLARLLHSVVSAIRCGNEGATVNASDFFSELRTRFPRYQGRNQEDSHEFFILLVNAIVNEEYALRKESFWRDIGPPLLAFPTSGWFGVDIRCEMCQIFHQENGGDNPSLRRVLEPFTCISCPIASVSISHPLVIPHAASLETCLAHTLARERVPELDCTWCTLRNEGKVANRSSAPPRRHTAARSPGSVQRSIARYPRVLCVHVERLQWSRVGQVKDERCVPAPRWLECGGARYHLTALIVHRGNARAGHYEAYVRYGTVWYRVSDTVVEPVCAQDLARLPFYMVLYERGDA